MCAVWADESEAKYAAGAADRGYPGAGRAGIALFRELPWTAGQRLLPCTDSALSHRHLPPSSSGYSPLWTSPLRYAASTAGVSGRQFRFSWRAMAGCAQRRSSRRVDRGGYPSFGTSVATRSLHVETCLTPASGRLSGDPLTALDEVAVRVAQVAAEFMTPVCGRCQELGPAGAPLLVDGVDVGDADV
jgi:hypothetical protein